MKETSWARRRDRRQPFVLLTLLVICLGLVHIFACITWVYPFLLEGETKAAYREGHSLGIAKFMAGSFTVFLNVPFFGLIWLFSFTTELGQLLILDIPWRILQSIDLNLAFRKGLKGMSSLERKCVKGMLRELHKHRHELRRFSEGGDGSELTNRSALSQVRSSVLWLDEVEEGLLKQVLDPRRQLSGTTRQSVSDG